MRVIFVRMRDEDREANTPLSAPAIIGFGPYGGRKICNCGPLGGTVGKTRLERAVLGGLRRLWRLVSKKEPKGKNKNLQYATEETTSRRCFS